MKEELLKILIYLKETNSWDLAEELAIGVYKKEEINSRFFKSISSFMKIAINLSDDELKQEKLKNAFKKIELMKKEEKNERIKESKNDILSELDLI